MHPQTEPSNEHDLGAPPIEWDEIYRAEPGTYTVAPLDAHEELLRKFDRKLLAGLPRVFSTPEAATEIFGRSTQWVYYHLKKGTFSHPPVWHYRTDDDDNWYVCEHPNGKPFTPNDDVKGGRYIHEKTGQTVSRLGEREREVFGQEERVWREVDGTMSYRYFGDRIEPIQVGANRYRYTVEILRDFAGALFRHGLVKMPEMKVILGRLLIAEHGEEAQALIEVGIVEPWTR